MNICLVSGLGYCCNCEISAGVCLDHEIHRLTFSGLMVSLRFFLCKYTQLNILFNHLVVIIGSNRSI